MSETLNALLTGFGVALAPINLLWGLVGVTLGTAVGVLPGVGPALTVAMLLPLTVKLDPTGALIMFAGIYYGAMYGGSTTTILLNTPGESASIATALEGNKMAKRGRAGPALATAAIGSFVAGTIATILLTLLAPLVVEVALQVRADRVLRADGLRLRDRRRGARLVDRARADDRCSSACCSGWSASTSRPARCASRSACRSCSTASTWSCSRSACSPSARRSMSPPTRAARPRRWKQLCGRCGCHARTGGARGRPGCGRTAIGFPFGTIPAGGAEIPTFLVLRAREEAQQASRGIRRRARSKAWPGPKRPTMRRSTGVLVPLLTLGIPTSATAAILLAAFQNYGIQPGPLLFQTQGALVWGLIASLYVGNVLLLVLNLPLIGLWVQVLMIPRPLLYAGILVFATLGAYSLHQSYVDLLTLYVFGLLGFMMRRWGFPVAPAVIGLILGPLAESQFRRALAISQGDPSVFFTHPISATLLALTAALVLVPWLVRVVREWRGRAAV